MNVQKLFDRYNRRFFEGSLQGWTVYEGHLSDLPAKGRNREYGDCDAEAKEIFIQIGLSPTEKRKTLLHEMCHAVASDQCHDQSWQREMFRIAEMGAPGMASEARSYAARLHAKAAARC